MQWRNPEIYRWDNRMNPRVWYGTPSKRSHRASRVSFAKPVESPVRELYLHLTQKYLVLTPIGVLIPALTHWGRVTHIRACKLTIIGSDNGLSPCRRQVIISTNAGILLIGPLGANFSDILIEIHTFALQKMHLKMSSAKGRPFCPGLKLLILIQCSLQKHENANGSNFSSTFENNIV